MLVKSRLFVLGLVGVLGAVGYFALRPAHSSPALVEKRVEGPVEPSHLTWITGLPRSRDGHILATVYAPLANSLFFTLTIFGS